MGSENQNQKRRFPLIIPHLVNTLLILKKDKQKWHYKDLLVYYF